MLRYKLTCPGATQWPALADTHPPSLYSRCILGTPTARANDCKPRCARVHGLLNFSGVREKGRKRESAYMCTLLAYGFRNVCHAEQSPRMCVLPYAPPRGRKFYNRLRGKPFKLRNYVITGGALFGAAAPHGSLNIARLYLFHALRAFGRAYGNAAF